MPPITLFWYLCAVAGGAFVLGLIGILLAVLWFAILGWAKKPE